MTASVAFSAAAQERAEGLFSELRQALINAERVVIEIIQTRAWEALGYRSFEQAFNDRLRGVRLATSAMKAHVVYALLDTADRETVVAATGVSPSVVDALEKQRSEGIPADLATVVRRHQRRLPTEPRTVHVTVTPAEYRAWSRIAKDRGEDLSVLCALALREHFGSQA